MHSSYDEVIEDVRETTRLLKEQADLGWGVWVVGLIIAVLAYTSDEIGLLRGIFVMAALGFYCAYRWHAELNRRLLLSHRLQMTLLKRALPAGDER